VDGPRRTGKTIGCCHKILRHAWETPQARIAIFARTRKSAEQGGVFTDLVETVLGEWAEGNFGFKILKGPKVDGATRLLYMDVSNMYGGASRIQLHSLDYDFDVEAAVRSTRFSMIYFSELSNFLNRIIFTITSEQLRMPHLPPESHHWLADTNPAQEGEQSWIYNLFYTERLAENHPYPSEQAKYNVIHVTLDDNPFVSDDEKQSIAARHAHDRNLYDRYYLGLWKRRTEDGIFADVYMADTHVLGRLDAFEEEKSEILLPTDTCSILLSGWDPGSKNHSAHIIEQVGGPHNQSIYLVLDELVAINTPVPITDFTEAFVERMDFWEGYIREHCHKNPLEWKHWSDTSSFDQFRAGLGGYDHSVISVASAGRIMLMAAPKGRGSIFKRIDILHRLLFQNRIFISARCVRTIAMLGNLRRGKTKLDPVERSEHKHVFDSLTYALGASAFWELSESWAGPKVGTTSELVSVRL